MGRRVVRAWIAVAVLGAALAGAWALRASWRGETPRVAEPTAATTENPPAARASQPQTPEPPAARTETATPTVAADDLPPLVRELRATWTERIRGRLVMKDGGAPPADAVVSLRTERDDLDRAETVARLGGVSAHSALLRRGRLEAAITAIGGWQSSFRSRASGDGSFEIAVPPDLPRFHFEVEADYASFPGADEWHVRDESAARDGFVLTLETAGAVAGRLLGPSGKPLPSAGVFLASAEGVPAPRRPFGGPGPATGEDGAFRIPAVAPGTYAAVFVVKGVGASRREGVVVRAGETTRFEHAVELAAFMSGQVVEPPAAGCANARVWATLEKADGSLDASKTQMGSTDGRGRFLLKLSGPGRYSLFVDPQSGRVGGELHGLVVPDAGGLEDVRVALLDGNAVAGVVLDQGRQPVAGAWVEVRFDHERRREPGRGTSGRDETDEQGRFRIGGLAAGPFLVEATKEGVSTAELEGVEPGSTVELILPPPTGISGRVVAADTGAPVEAFSVSSSWRRQRVRGMSASGGPGKAFRSGEGTFELLGLKAGSYELRVESAGFVGEPIAAIEVEVGRIREGTEIRLARGVTIRGTVWNAAAGAPVHGASVSIVASPDGGPGGTRRMRSDSSISANSATDGSFELTGLRAGTIRLRSEAAGLPEGTAEPIEAIPGQTVEGIRIVHSSGGAIEGVAISATGRPIEAGFVDARPERVDGPQIESFLGSRSPARTGADGSFRIERLAPGIYTVQARPAPIPEEPPIVSTRRVLEARGVVVEDGKTTRVDFAPKWTGCRVYGQVAVAGKGLGGVELTLRPDAIATREDSLMTAVSDPDGSYAILGVPPGGAGMEVIHRVGAGYSGRFFRIEIPAAAEFAFDPPIPSGTIEGRVVRASDGAAVVGASVHARSPERAPGQGQAYTESDGRFSIGMLLPQAYEVTAYPERARFAGGGEAKSLAPLVRTGVSVNDGASVTVDFALEAGATLVATIIDESGARVPTTYVSTVDNSRSENSDSNGIARIEGVALGRQRVRARHSDFAPAVSEEVEFEAGEETRVTLTLRRGTEVRVRLVDPDGRTLDRPRAEIVLEGGVSDWAWARAADPTEATAILVPAEYTFRIHRPGFRMKEETVRVGSVSPQEVVIRLERADGG